LKLRPHLKAPSHPLPSDARSAVAVRPLHVFAVFVSGVEGARRYEAGGDEEEHVGKPLDSNP